MRLPVDGKNCLPFPCSARGARVASQDVRFEGWEPTELVQISARLQWNGLQPQRATNTMLRTTAWRPSTDARGRHGGLRCRTRSTANTNGDVRCVAVMVAPANSAVLHGKIAYCVFLSRCAARGLGVEEEPARRDERPARVGHLPVAGQPLKLVHGLTHVTRGLGGSFRQRSPVRIDPEPLTRPSPSVRRRASAIPPVDARPGGVD